MQDLSGEFAYVASHNVGSLIGPRTDLNRARNVLTEIVAVGVVMTAPFRNGEIAAKI